MWHFLRRFFIEIHAVSDWPIVPLDDRLLVPRVDCPPREINMSVSPKLLVVIVVALVLCVSLRMGVVFIWSDVELFHRGAEVLRDRPIVTTVYLFA